MRESREEGKASHGGHGGHRGGSGWWVKLLSGTLCSWVRESREEGKHRTEVTEVTEGDRVGGRNFCREHCGLGARNTRRGKASHRGHEGHRGGSGWWAKLLSGTLWPGVRESREGGKASHRGHGGHRGGSGWWVKLLSGTRALGCENHAKRESIAQRSWRSQRGIGLVHSIVSTPFGVFRVSSFNGIRSRVV